MEGEEDASGVRDKIIKRLLGEPLAGDVKAGGGRLPGRGVGELRGIHRLHSSSEP